MKNSKVIGRGFGVSSLVFRSMKIRYYTKNSLILIFIVMFCILAGCGKTEDATNSEHQGVVNSETNDISDITIKEEPRLLVGSIENSVEKQPGYVGESLYTGLYYLGNGEYQTQDGRFTAKSGQAVIISDGETNIYKSRFAVAEHGLEVTIENEYGFKIQHFFKSSDKGWNVGIFDSDKLTFDMSSYKDGICTDVYGTPYIPLSPFLQYHEHYERYVFACHDFTGEITGLTLRVIYNDGTTAVFYSCATYKTAPNTVETFIVVPLNTEQEQEDGEYNNGEVYIPDSQSTTKECWRCNGSGWRECGVCDGTGYREDWGNNVPNYDGKYTNKYTLKKCTNCTDGKVKCSTCGGDGKQ